MKQFKNILVGVDLSQGDRLVSDELPPPTLEAIERALWLAKLNSSATSVLQRNRYFCSGSAND